VKWSLDRWAIAFDIPQSGRHRGVLGLAIALQTDQAPSRRQGKALRCEKIPCPRKKKRASRYRVAKASNRCVPMAVFEDPGASELGNEQRPLDHFDGGSVGMNDLDELNEHLHAQL
jgi:hypothetical protein